MTAILSLSASAEVILAAVLFFAAVWFFGWLDYKRICHKAPVSVEVEENRDFQWPPKSYPPHGRYVGPKGKK